MWNMQYFFREGKGGLGGGMGVEVGGGGVRRGVGWRGWEWVGWVGEKRRQEIEAVCVEKVLKALGRENVLSV